MKPNLVHVFLNVTDKSISFPFYKDILGNLGYEVEFEDNDNLGMNNGQTEIWLRPSYSSDPQKFDRRAVGINHLAFRVETTEEVDRFVREIILPKGMRVLFDSPKTFPAFTKDYYAVYFEDPDGIKIEVCCYTV